MRMDKNRPEFYRQLADKWKRGTISPEEKKLLEEWYSRYDDTPIEIDGNFASDEETHAARIFQKILAKIEYKTNNAGRPKHISLKHYARRFAAAAVLVLMLASAAYLFFYNKPASQSPTAINDIAPGVKGAVLHLWNGTAVTLNKEKYGNKIAELYASAIKNTKSSARDSDSYNEIVTSNGKQWKMVLPDGTKVWLNAGSTLRFPVSYNQTDERIVELSGEAYFDVVHNPQKPFIVKAGNEEIKDIGTVFNVSSYPGEILKTTLISGAIRVGSHLLKPGQQAVMKDKTIAIQNINTYTASAWVNGQFSMENVTVAEFMNQLSRWYNVEIDYKSAPPEAVLGGFLDRNVPISNIIAVLNAAGIKAKITGRKIIIL